MVTTGFGHYRSSAVYGRLELGKNNISPESQHKGRRGIVVCMSHELLFLDIITRALQWC